MTATPPRPDDTQSIGPYRTVRELGRGGQAIVYLARDTRIDRQVALKVLANLGPGSEELLQRFRREAEAASRLDHPNICAVHEADVDRGVPYIAMRFVRGDTLAKRIATARGTGAAPPSREELLELVALFEKAARALHAAHEAGVIHRDVKPGNIMVTPEGEPVILDFGLARADLESAQSLSVSGAVSGTPAYMSPEQMTGRARPDRRADVYSLGATLQECATLRHPFEAATREELYHAILTREPTDPRRANPAIGRDLAVILETALQKDRDRRYQSAWDLAEDLRRLRALEPIRARPVGHVERLRRWVQRNPALAASHAAVVVMLVVASALLSHGIGASGKADVEASLRKLADDARNRAEEQRQKLVQLEQDRRVGERLEDLSMRMGALVFGFDAEREARALGPQLLAALADFGIDLTRPGAAPSAVASLAALKERNPATWRTVAAGIRNLGWVLVDESGESGLALRQTLAVLASLPEGAWKEADAAAERWRRDQVDEFDAVLAEPALSGKSADQLAELAGNLMSVPGRLARSLELLDRAIRLDPGAFQLHFRRGGVGLLELPPLRAKGGPELQERIGKIVHHLRVAVALRPASGFCRAMLANALALAGEYREATDCIEESTRLEPESAIAWLMKARFYGYSPYPELGVAACTKALALDPGLSGGRELLETLKKLEAEKPK